MIFRRNDRAICRNWSGKERELCCTECFTENPSHNLIWIFNPRHFICLKLRSFSLYSFCQIGCSCCKQFFAFFRRLKIILIMLNLWFSQQIIFCLWGFEPLSLVRLKMQTRRRSLWRQRKKVETRIGALQLVFSKKHIHISHILISTY